MFTEVRSRWYERVKHGSVQKFRGAVDDAETRVKGEKRRLGTLKASKSDNRDGEGFSRQFN